MCWFSDLRARISTDIPREVSAVMQKMMDPLPSERYQSMGEVVAALDRS